MKALLIIGIAVVVIVIFLFLRAAIQVGKEMDADFNDDTREFK